MKADMQLHASTTLDSHTFNLAKHYLQSSHRSLRNIGHCGKQQWFFLRVAKVAQLPSPDRMHTVTFNPPPSPAPCISVIFLRANLHSPQPHRKLKAADQADPYSHNEADRSLQAFSNERTSPLLGR